MRKKKIRGRWLRLSWRCLFSISHWVSSCFFIKRSKTKLFAFCVFRSLSHLLPQEYAPGVMVIKLYYSSTTSSRMIKKQQKHIQDVLEIMKVEFELIDLMVNKEAQKKMRILSNNPIADPPQLFNDDHFCGNYEDFEDAVELKEVEKFLKL